MVFQELKKLAPRLFFSVEDLASDLEMRLASAKVLCSRYVKNGLFVRLKKNFYILDETWKGLSKEQLLKVSNLLQVPSYVSLMTALSWHEVTTQVQRSFFESISFKRTARFDVKGTTFVYYKLKKELYFDFVKKDNIFIATKEKAFFDAMYLFSFGKYKLDVDSLDMGKLDINRIEKIARVFPKKTKDIITKICKI